MQSVQSLNAYFAHQKWLQMHKPVLTKIAIYRDETTDTYVEEYKFQKRDATFGKILIKPSEANKAHLFKQQLEDRYAYLPAGKECTSFLKEAAAQVPAANFVFAAQTGWRRNFRGYVLPNKFIGKSPFRIVGVKSPPLTAGVLDKVSSEGTVASWRTEVGDRAALSSVLMTALCAAFAAPLLALCDQPTFGICFSGPSRTGKSTATMLAASVIGISTKVAIPTWRTTDSALYERLPYYNDRLFPIDDLMTLKGNGTTKYDRVRSLAYAVSAQQETARFSTFSNKPAGAWRCIWITSNEYTLSRMAADAGEVRYDGENIRLIDLPVLHQTKAIFNYSKKNKNFKWRQRIFGELEAACRENHGTVFERYIDKLVRFQKRKDFLSNRQQYFRKRCAAHAKDAVTRDIADRFALLYAAGCLATKFKLVNWNRKLVEKALLHSFQASCTSIQRGNEQNATTKKLVTDFLKSLPKEGSGKVSFLQAGGYCNADRSMFVVSRKAFHDIFASPAQRRKAIEELTSTNRFKYVRQHRWPDGKRHYSYKIRQHDGQA